MEVAHRRAATGHRWLRAPTALASLVLFAGLLQQTFCMPAPPSLGSGFPATQNSPLSQLSSIDASQLEQFFLAQNAVASRNNRSPVIAQNSPPVLDAVVELKSPRVPNPVIESATLLSHIVSEGSDPFRQVAMRPSRNSGTPIAPAAFTLPNTGGNLQFRGAKAIDDDDDRLLLQLLAARANQANQNQFSQRTVNVNPTSVSGGGFVVPANLHFKASNQAFSNDFDDDKLLVASLGGDSSIISPSTLLHSSTSRVSNTNLNTPITNLNNIDSLTVGDLVRSLDGTNGIRVLSLGDLRKSTPVAQTPTDGTMLQQLRNALISENIKLSDAQLNRQNGIVGLDIGVPLPSANQNDNANRARGIFGLGGATGATTTSSDGAPRGTLEEVFPQINDVISAQESGNSGGGAIGDLLSAADGGSVGVPLPGLNNFEQDPLPFDDTSSTSIGTGLTGLTATLDDDSNDDIYDDDDYDYDFDDDIPALPPQPPDVFRTGISDILFTKGQWVGTLIGGLFDMGSSIGEGVSKIFNKNNDE